jgi:transmembrane sensor
MNAPERIEEQAALWVVRLERGLTAAEQDEFLEWLTADPRHGAELSRQKTSWNRLDLLAQWRPEHAPRPNRDLLAPPPPQRIKAWILRPGVWLPVGAMAAAAIFAVALFLARTTERPSPTPTRVASIEERTLEDGSVVTLNRGATIAVAFTPTERRVTLTHGEANFAVAKNPARPFIVSAGGVAIRAVGTAFNVRLAATAVEVVVTEGKVEVNAPTAADTSPRSVLAAGERTLVSLAPNASAPQITAVTPTQMQGMLAWQPRMLDFTARPLREIVAEFNRANAPVEVVIVDPALAETPITAALRSDNIEGFVRMLEFGAGIRADRAGDTITLRKAP